jgi:HAMP domain-containing protein
MIAIALLPSLVVIPMLAGLSRSISQRQAAATLQTTAAAVSEQLSRGLLDQWYEVKRLASFAEQGDSRETMRLRLDTVVATDQQYAWVGLADPAGAVLVASGGILDGVSVAERPWFKAGLTGPYAGDVHDALLLQKLVAPNALEPLRLIDFALPVKRADGVPVGVLGAHVRWEAVREMFRAPRAGGSIELLLLSADGTVLVGPPSLEGKKLPGAFALAAGQGIERSGVETWPDGRTYLTSVLPAVGKGDIPSFGWSLVARQPTEVALVDTYAAASRMLPIILLCGVFIVVVSLGFAWWVARPLSRLAIAADQLSQGPAQAPVPHERAYREVSILSEALARLDSKTSGRTGKP